MTLPDRPLRLGEILAETIQLYSRRLWPAFGLGAIEGGAYLLAFVTPPLLGIFVIALVFTSLFAAAARLVAGDSFAAAWLEVGRRAPELLVLTLVVAGPALVAVGQLYLLIPSALWLALMGFSIPVAVIEPAEGNLLDRLAFALVRSIRLARAEYLHALGVIAALVVIYLLFSVLLVAGLIGFAENGGAVAAALAQVVLAPFFFLGFAVLYFEQRTRVSPPAAPPRAAS